MPIAIIEGAKYKNLSASALVKTGAGKAIAIVVNSHTGGTIKLWDALTAVAPILVNTYTFATGSQVIPLYGAEFKIGLYATLSATADVTILYI